MDPKKTLLEVATASILRAALTLWLIYGVVENSFAGRDGMEAHIYGAAGLTHLLSESSLDNFNRILSRNDVSLEEFGSALGKCLNTAQCSDKAWVDWRASLAFRDDFKNGVYSLTSAKAMNEICLYLEKSLSETRPLSDAAYLLFRNSFNTIMHSEEYCVRNRVAPENRYVEIVINYLWYSGCFDRIGAEKVISMLNENMSHGDVTLEDFATGLCKLIMDDINDARTPEGKQLRIEEGVQNFCKHIKDMREVLESNRLTQDSIYSDNLVFVQDWWNVRSDDIQQIKNFIRRILGAYVYPGPNIRSLPKKVSDVMRPYIMLILTGCPFAAYTDDISDKTCNAVLDAVMVQCADRIIDLQKEIVLKSSVDLQEGLIGNKKYFHFSPQISLNRKQEDLIRKQEDFIKCERFFSFYPLPLNCKIASCYWPRVKHVIVNAFLKHPMAQIKDIPEKILLKPYVQLVLKKAGLPVDDFDKLTTGKVLDISQVLDISSLPIDNKPKP